MAVMAYKKLGESNPLATTLTALYTVPGGKQAIVSTGVICNRGAGVAKVRLSVAIAGAGDDVKQYLYYDLSVPANETFAFTFGVTLAATDVVRCYTDTATVSFSLFGSEIT